MTYGAARKVETWNSIVRLNHAETRKSVLESETMFQLVERLGRMRRSQIGRNGTTTQKIGNDRRPSLIRSGSSGKGQIRDQKRVQEKDVGRCRASSRLVKLRQDKLSE